MRWHAGGVPRKISEMTSEWTLNDETKLATQKSGSKNIPAQRQSLCKDTAVWMSVEAPEAGPQLGTGFILITPEDTVGWGL